MINDGFIFKKGEHFQGKLSWLDLHVTIMPLQHTVISLWIWSVSIQNINILHSQFSINRILFLLPLGDTLPPLGGSGRGLKGKGANFQLTCGRIRIHQNTSEKIPLPCRTYFPIGISEYVSKQLFVWHTILLRVKPAITLDSSCFPPRYARG
jgi:hypothetical protein